MKAPSSTVPPEREQEIAELAEAVADEYFPDRRVEPTAILKAKGVTLSFGHYGTSFDGLLECLRGRFHVYGNLDRVEGRDTPRARFTLGHELGHFFIDEHRNALRAGLAPSHPSVCEYESALPVEREADHFASNLLMPPARFNKLAVRAAAGLGGVLKIAEHFGTSVTSTAIRYAKSEIVPCAVIKWDGHGFGWKWLSTETFRARFRRTVETLSDLPEDSPTVRAISGERPPAQGYFTAGTTAAAWFPFVDDRGTRNVILIEQAMPLGRFGVLTVLYPESGSYGQAGFDPIRW